jgi:hypothetical protein
VNFNFKFVIISVSYSKLAAEASAIVVEAHRKKKLSEIYSMCFETMARNERKRESIKVLVP